MNHATAGILLLRKRRAVTWKHAANPGGTTGSKFLNAIPDIDRRLLDNPIPLFEYNEKFPHFNNPVV